MPDDYYNGDSGKPADKTENSDDAEDMAETFLAPASAFGPECEVGEKKMVEVMSKHGDELELKYVKKEDKEEADEQSEMPDDAMASVDAGVEKMKMM